MTAGEGEFDNAEQPYQEKFLLLSGTSTALGLSQAQRLFVQTIIKQLIVQADNNNNNNSNNKNNNKKNDNLLQFLIYISHKTILQMLH